MSAAPGNVAAFLPRRAAERPYAPAILSPSGRDAGGRPRFVHLTYRELDDLTDRVARGLARHGIGRGTRVVVMVPPGLELFTLVFGLFKAGAVPVVVDPGLGLGNLKRCLDEAEPEAFVGVPRAHVARVLLGWGRRTVRRCITVGRRGPWGGTTLERVLAEGGGGGAMAAVGPDEVAAVVFTSGSTGAPKGVVYRHGNFLAQVEMVGRVVGVRPGDVDLPTFPLFALFDPALGMTTVIPEMDPTRPAAVDPRRIVEAVDGWGATVMFGSPALLDTVGRWAVARGVRLPSLRTVTTAGAPIAPRIVERFAAVLRPEARILTPYGATESLPVACISHDAILDETRHATDSGRGTCVGRPVDGVEVTVARITDEPIASWAELESAPEGEIGEIVVRGPAVTAEYLNRPEATAAAKVALPDGGVAHRMGDVGYLDDAGRLWFCGRKAQRVVTAQGTLFTVPCEGVFNAHPAVFRSALVGVDRGRGTEPVMVVELDPEAGRVDRAGITGELLARAAEHEVTRSIRTVLFHPRFPVDVRHNAKIGREKLARWAAGRLK